MKLHSDTTVSAPSPTRKSILFALLRAMQRRHGENQLLGPVLFEINRGARM
jgi:hypothetical protein